MSSLLQRVRGIYAPATAAPVALDSGTYSPYAEKWKEFDRLQVLAGIPAWADWVAAVLMTIISDIFVHGIRTTGFTINIAIIIVAGFALRWVRSRASALEHWPCPRCHAEWPGTKTEKAPQCAVCGLKLHQMAP